MKNNNVDNEGTEMLSMKDKLKQLLILAFVLPESKVKGTDFLGRETPRGLMNSIDMKVLEARADMSADDIEWAEEEANDVIQGLLDDADGLNTNRQVDDLASRFEDIEKEEFDFAFTHHVSGVKHAWGIADEAQLRHERMTMRLAIVDHLRVTRQMEKAAELNDNTVERLLNGEAKFDEALKPFVVDMAVVRAKEAEVLKKNTSAHFRKILEEKANVLLEMSYIAEGFKKKLFRTQDEFEFIQLTIKKAQAVVEWVKLKEKRPRPYSKRALWALYNEGIDTLVALGVYKEAFHRTEFGTKVPCSFRVVPTASTMVEVKSGSDWTQEIASSFYEVSDGTSRTPLRGSND